MAREFTRNQRVGDALLRELSSLIQFEIRDPRVGMVNINEVEVTRDLSYAKVFVTFVDRDNEEDAKEALAALNNATGFLRGLISKNIQMRITPKIRFVYDTSVRRGQELSALINKAVKEDESRQDDAATPGADEE
ncbi:MAG: 30S ribosome-binding factor RbfA [Cellvibrionaceae bacterium]